jgi:hypothetical protein
MMQDEIASAFRAQELQRRAGRKQRLMNELALDNEQLTEQDRAADLEAKRRLKESALRLEKEISPSYWKRLWAALLGR